MWVLTNFGFFSVVQKPGDKAAGLITVRSRVRADLENLRAGYLPDMGIIEEDAGTDYRYRARVPHQSFARAAKKIALDVDYSNFKNSVAAQQGHKRAHIYHKVWDTLYNLEEEEKDGAGPLVSTHNHPDKKRAYGGILFDRVGRVLLRKPAGEFDGYAWTFAKGRINEGASPEETALREVYEETGCKARIMARIPGAFEGGTTVNEYFLMSPVGEAQPFDPGETAEIRWVPLSEAPALIRRTRNVAGQKRDLAVLAAVQKMLNPGPADQDRDA